MTDMKVVPDGKVGYDFIILSMVKVNSASRALSIGEWRRLHCVIRLAVQYTDGNASVYVLAEHLIIYGNIHHWCDIGAYSLGQHQQVPEGRTVERPFQLREREF